MNKMQKIPCQEAFNHEAFEIANTFIKQKIEQIASHIPKTNEDEMEKRILNHYNMVAQITHYVPFHYRVLYGKRSERFKQTNRKNC